MTLSREEQLNSCQFDMPTAYLWNAERKHRILMRQPKGYEVPGTEDMVYEIGTYLYGEPPAGLQWWYGLCAGFKRNPACPALFVKVVKRNKPCYEVYYDAPENAYRRIKMFGPGQDFTATYVLRESSE